MNPEQAKTRLWDRFWKAGRGACCAAGGSPSLSEDLQQPWRLFFGSLQESDKVLDLCTGNGAVLLVALDCAEQNGVSVELHGVDAASIEPRADVPALSDRLARITFHARTEITALPFEDATFDCVTSQYGIEYAPLPEASIEIMRVLRPGGRGQFVLHAAEGVTVEYARRELADIAELLQDTGIFPAAREALRRVCGVERGPAASDEIEAARNAHDTFHECLTALGARWQERTAAEVFRETGAILQHTFRNRRSFPLDVLLDKIRETEESVELHRDRLQALTAAATTSRDCQQIRQRFIELGCGEACVEALHDTAGEHLLGWTIGIRK